MGRKKWSKQKVLAEVRKWYQSGRPHEAIKREWPALSSAIHYYFGKRANLMAAMGVDYQPPRRPTKARTKWSRQRIVEEIRRLHRQGQPLSSHVHRTLAGVAWYHFGSWRQAVLSAGFQPLSRNWTREDVLTELQRRHEQGHLRSCEADNKLRFAAVKHFGNWHAALQAAGIPPRRPAPQLPLRRWTREQVIAGIQAHWQKHRSFRRMWIDHTSMYTAAQRYYGNWAAAVRAAGLKPRTMKRWSNQIVIDELRKCQGDARHDKGLREAARLRFGSLDAARKAAGLPVPLRWTRELVICAMQKRYIRGQSLLTTGCPTALVWAAQNRFGSWHEALRVAGLGHVIEERHVRNRNVRRSS